MKKTLLAILAIVLPLAAQMDVRSPRAAQFPFTFTTGNMTNQLKQVGVSPAQLAQIDTIMQENRQLLIDQLAEIDKKEAEFQTVLTQQQLDQSQAELAVHAMIDARDRLARTQTLMLVKIRVVLTSEQWNRMAQRQVANNNEASALATVRVLNTAENVIRATYNRGFSDGLNRLGTPANGAQPSENFADLVDPVLSGVTSGSNSTFTKNGYKFSYTPGPGAFGSIQTYKITGQPIQYGVSGTRSFFTDQSGIIRWTNENRAATAEDPSI